MMSIDSSLMRGNIPDLDVERVSLPCKSEDLPSAGIYDGIWYHKGCLNTIFLSSVLRNGEYHKMETPSVFHYHYFTPFVFATIREDEGPFPRSQVISENSGSWLWKNTGMIGS